MYVNFGPCKVKRVSVAIVGSGNFAALFCRQSEVQGGGFTETRCSSLVLFTSELSRIW